MFHRTAEIPSGLQDVGNQDRGRVDLSHIPEAKDISDQTIYFHLAPFDLGRGNTPRARAFGVYNAVAGLAEGLTDLSRTVTVDESVYSITPHVNITLPPGLNHDARIEGQIAARRITNALQRVLRLQALANAADSGQINDQALKREGIAGTDDVRGEILNISRTVLPNRMRDLSNVLAPRETRGFLGALRFRRSDGEGRDQQLVVSRDGVRSAVVYRIPDSVLSRSPGSNRFIRNAVLFGAAGATLGCTVIQSTEAPQVPKPIELSLKPLSLGDAKTSVLDWQNVTIGEQANMHVVGDVEFLKDPSTQELLTLSPLQSDGTAYTPIQWAFARATIVGNNEKATLPMIVVRNAETGETNHFGLFLEEGSTADTLIFRADIVEGGSVKKTELLITVYRGQNGTTITVEDQAHNATYRLVTTPKNKGIQPSPTEVPQSVIDILVSVFTGARAALAQASTPTKEATVEPSPLPPATEVPTVEQTPSNWDTLPQEKQFEYLNRTLWPKLKAWAGKVPFGIFSLDDPAIANTMEPRRLRNLGLTSQSWYPKYVKEAIVVVGGVLPAPDGSALWPDPENGKSYYRVAIPYAETMEEGRIVLKRWLIVRVMNIDPDKCEIVFGLDGKGNYVEGVVPSSSIYVNGGFYSEDLMIAGKPVYASLFLRAYPWSNFASDTACRNIEHASAKDADPPLELMLKSEQVTGALVYYLERKYSFHLATVLIGEP